MRRLKTTSHQQLLLPLTRRFSLTSSSAAKINWPTTTAHKAASRSWIDQQNQPAPGVRRIQCRQSHTSPSPLKMMSPLAAATVTNDNQLLATSNRCLHTGRPYCLPDSGKQPPDTTGAQSGSGGGGGGGSHSEWESFLLSTPNKHVAHVELNRPKVKNAFGLKSALEFVQLLDRLEDDAAIRCVLLSGSGPDFTSGVDLKSFMTVYGQLQETEDVGRKAKLLRSIIQKFQAPFKRMELFSKPILCVQHGLCYGLGMELAACSDIRYCSADTKYSIREVLIGIAADVGSLQKMPHLVSNQSLLRELIYTGRDVGAEEALRLGLVSRICGSKEEAMAAALGTATTIATRSPVAVQGSKLNLQFSGDKSFEVGLDYNAIWNMSMMQSNDVVKAIETILSRSGEEADYENF